MKRVIWGVIFIGAIVFFLIWQQQASRQTTVDPPPPESRSASPQAEPYTTSETNTETNTATDPYAELDAELEPRVVVEAGPESDTESEEKLEPGTVTDPDAEPDAESESRVVVEAGPESDTESEAKLEPGTATDPYTELDAESEPRVVMEAGPESETESLPEIKADAKTKVKVGSGQGRRATAKIKAKVKARVKAKVLYDKDFFDAILFAEKKAASHGSKVLRVGRRMTDHQEIIRGACWDYANAVYNRAGYSSGKRKVVFRGSKNKGPYANAELIQPGDWLYYINHLYGGIEHSAIFVDWIDYRKKRGLMLSYSGGGRKEPARYMVYDLTNVYNVTRPKK